VRKLTERTRELHGLVEERTRAQEALAESNRKLEQAMEDLQHAQERLVQQERLRALGQMASGVTHDFNNALTPILGFTDFLLSRPQILDDREKTLAYLANVNTAAKDASQVVKRLREFYRPRDEAEVFPLVAVDAILRQAVSLTQPKWKDQAQARGVSIDVETQLLPTPLIPGSESALREMLTNMIFNAVDAMPQGGKITLRSRHEGHVVIEVVDTGTGMTEEVRSRCLEPFFTTKGEEGTGLGLPMVYGIASRHDGTIEIESIPGKGTTFRVLLPVEPSAVLGEETTMASRKRSGVGPLRVLVVDDEGRIRSLIGAYLAADGHEAVMAEDGADGLEKLRTSSFDLVITDRSMPRMSGEQMAVAAKRRNPELPILLLTGFGEVMAQEKKPAGVDLIVSKPVTADALRDAIGTLIAARKSPAAPRAAA
jgi:signal transduction histidine kinase/ActR/RegA family two-component response regulator